MFDQGQIVKCVDASDVPGAKFKVSKYIYEGGIYHISWIGKDGAKEDSVELFEVEGNKRFKAKRFRPLDGPEPSLKKIYEALDNLSEEEKKLLEEDNPYLVPDTVAASNNNQIDS